MEKKNLFRSLLSIDEYSKLFISKYGKISTEKNINECLRYAVDDIKKKISSGLITATIEPNHIIKAAKSLLLEKYNTEINPVINATGTIIHTNLGRSLISENIAKKAMQAATEYVDLEMNLFTGKRNHRGVQIATVIKELFDVEDALIVNNNAAAILLILSTFSKDKSVIISRGEEVEIGGSFRIPDVMKSSGCKLIEVGTTNKTYIKDYEDAIDENTSLIMKIHTSNFKVVGFTHETDLKELNILCKKHSIPLAYDLGSGCIYDFANYFRIDEPFINSHIIKNTDIITFSGDKLLGSCQAGIIIGKHSYIEKLRKNPMYRALRVDKITMSILLETFKLYRNIDVAKKEIPTLSMLTESYESLYEKVNFIFNAIKDNFNCRIIDSFSTCGGGAMPTLKIKSPVLSITHPYVSVNELANKLRNNKIPVLARIQHDTLIIDVRTVKNNHIEKIINVLNNLELIDNE